MPIMDILTMGDFDEVVSSDAIFNLAEMTNLQSFGGCSESESMSIGQSSTIPEMPITLGIKGANPEMTVAKLGMEWGQRPVFIDVPPEPFFRWESYVDAWHTHDYTSLVMS